MRSLLLCIVFLSSSFVLAKPVKKVVSRTPASTVVRVVYGDRISVFQVTNAKKEVRVDFANNIGVRKFATLTPADFEFFQSKIAKIKGASNRRELCPRSYVIVSGAAVKNEIVGCLGSNNAVAKELQSTVNALGLLF